MVINEIIINFKSSFMLPKFVLLTKYLDENNVRHVTSIRILVLAYILCATNQWACQIINLMTIDAYLSHKNVISF